MIIPILVIVFSAYANASTGLIGAFLVGLWYDVWHGNPLGITSAILLGIVILVNWYKRKFTATTIWFLVPLSFFIMLFIKMITEQTIAVSFDLMFVLKTVLTTILFYFIFLFIWRAVYTPKKLSV